MFTEAHVEPTAEGAQTSGSPTGTDAFDRAASANDGSADAAGDTALRVFRCDDDDSAKIRC